MQAFLLLIVALVAACVSADQVAESLQAKIASALFAPPVPRFSGPTGAQCRTPAFKDNSACRGTAPEGTYYPQGDGLEWNKPCAAGACTKIVNKCNNLSKQVSANNLCGVGFQVSNNQFPNGFYNCLCQQCIGSAVNDCADYIQDCISHDYNGNVGVIATAPNPGGFQTYNCYWPEQ